MSNSNPYRITLEDLYAKATELTNNGYDIYWFYAIRSGWYKPQYLHLYKAYIKSALINLSSHDDALNVKGKPLERLAFYFLKEGGIVNDIIELRAHQRWQVDGQGPLNKSSLVICVGEEWCKKAGFQLYMEAKNHKESISGDEFSSHHRRMDEHECNVGLCISTAGYRISGGKGIAESIHRNTWKSKYHLLMTIEGFYKVAEENIAPLRILQEILGYAVNDVYANDKEIQSRYSQRYCLDLAKSEYERLFT